MQHAQQNPEPARFTTPLEHFTGLVELAGMQHEQATRCRDAGLWTAAVMHFAGSVESALLATACVFEPELRQAGLWPRDPFKCTLGQLAKIARDAGWLPVQPAAITDGPAREARPSHAEDDLFAFLDGQIGDAMKFVERVRNMMVHPGAFIRASERPDVTSETHMRPTCDLIEAILGQVFDYLDTQMQTLP